MLIKVVNAANILRIDYNCSITIQIKIEGREIKFLQAGYFVEYKETKFCIYRTN
jgi:hypothetical protein